MAIFSALALGVLLSSGCGGNGGGMSGGGTTGGAGGQSGPVSGAPSVLAATFQVDANTGKVSILSQKGSLSGSDLKRPGLFTGNSIGFQSSELSSDTLGGTGIRSLQVSLVNNTDVTIGVDGNGAVSGLNVIFGAFVNTTGVQDQRPNTRVSTFAGSSGGFADGPASSALFKNPAATAFGADGAIYVADFSNNRIRKIKSGAVTTLAGTGAAAETDGGTTAAAFKGPYAIALNPVDNALIVADFNGDTIRRVTTAGLVSTVAGTGTAGSANGAGNIASFSNPTGVAVDGSGNIYVSESNSNRIRKIAFGGGSPGSSANYTVTTFAGNGTGGHVDGPGPSAEFYRPFGLACDSNGSIFVSDYSNNMIRKVDAGANVTTIAGSGVQSSLDGYGNTCTFNHPFGIASLNGALYVCDSSGQKVREVVPVTGGGSGPSSWVVETLAGTGSAGSANGAGNTATFNSPYGIAASPGSSLFVADFVGNQIREINPSTGTFPVGNIGTSTSAEPVRLSNPTGHMDNTDLGVAPYISYAGSLKPGQTGSPLAWNFVIPAGVTSFQFQVMVEANTNQLIPLQSAVGAGSPYVDVRTFTGSTGSGYLDGTATNSLFNAPSAIATDANGNLYVSDSNNNAIRRVDASGNVSTIAGSTGAGSADGAGNVATFSSPAYLTVSPDGTEIFLCDYYNDAIRRITLSGGDPTNPADWEVTTIAGSNGFGYTDGLGSTAQFYSPSGIVQLSPNELYIGEFGGNRIRSLRFLGGDRSSKANWLVGTVAGDTSGAIGASGHVDANGTAARFSDMQGMCTDGQGNVYVAETINEDIRKIDANANVTTLAGSGSAGYLDGPALSADFYYPADVKVDPAGYFYVADANNYRIRRISPGGQVSTVAGNGVNARVDGPGNVAEIKYPNGIALNASGTLFIVCTQDNNVRLVQTAVASGSPSSR